MRQVYVCDKSEHRKQEREMWAAASMAVLLRHEQQGERERVAQTGNQSSPSPAYGRTESKSLLMQAFLQEDQEGSKFLGSLKCA